MSSLPAIQARVFQHRVRDFGPLKKIARQQVVHVGGHHSNGSRLIASKCEQSWQNLVQ